MLFDNGELFLSGAPKLVVSRYQKLLSAPRAKIAAIRAEIRASSSDKDIIPPTEKMPISSEAEKNLTQKQDYSAFYDPNLRSQSAVIYESRGAIISEPKILSMSGEQVNVLLHGEDYVYTYTVLFEEDAYKVRFGSLIKTVTGLELGGMVSHSSADTIDFIEKGSVMQPHFGFRCSLLSGAYFMNAGVVGAIDGTELPLHRIIDALMFKVQPEPNMLVHGAVNFSINPLPAHVTRIK